MDDGARVPFHGEYRDRSAVFTIGLVIAIVATLMIGAAQTYFRYQAEQDPRADAGTADLLRVVLVVAVCGTLIGVVRWMQKELWTLRVTENSITWSGQTAAVQVDLRHVEAIALRADENGTGMTVVMDDGGMYLIPPLCLMTDVGRFCEVMHEHFPRVGLTYNDQPVCESCGRPVRVSSRRRLTAEHEKIFCKCAPA